MGLVKQAKKEVGEELEEEGALIVAQGPIIRNTEYCEGVCHRASQCRRNPDNKELPGVGGVVKKAGAERGRLTKAEKHRLNKQKKKAEEAAKQAEIEAVKKATIETFNVSNDTEEDLLKKSELHSARQA